MSLQRMDADTAGTVAGSSGYCRRAAGVVWRMSRPELLGNLASCGRRVQPGGDDASNVLPDGIPVDAVCPRVWNEPAALLSSAERLLRRMR